MRILVTRPQQDGEEIAARLAEKGHHALLAPLLEPHFHDHVIPVLDDVQALLATSANGVRAFARTSPRRDLSVFAVGPQTAEEARKAGFADVRSADGDAKDLALAASRWAAQGKGVLLHVCGEEAPGTLAENLTLRGFKVRRCALYRMETATQLPAQARDAIRQGVLDAAMFFSPRSARVFGVLADGLPTEKLAALCISKATAAALMEISFASVAVAERPNQAAMLALVE
jgi:uroporphyrinogen-III synthase